MKTETIKKSTLEDSDEELPESITAAPEDLHDPKKIILQRQFYEAVVRAAAVAFANDNSLPKLSDKLDFAMKNHFLPLA
jgi:hypothetical protein